MHFKNCMCWQSPLMVEGDCFSSWSCSAFPRQPVQHLARTTRMERERSIIKQIENVHLCRLEFLCFPVGWLGVKQSLQRTDRQWLHSNLWGGSVTALFLAPHSRVSVSCGSYQLPGLMIGPRLSHPPVPAVVFQFSCPTDVTVASCKGGGGCSDCKWSDWQNSGHTH